MQMEGGERMTEFPAPFFHKCDSRRSILKRAQVDRDEIKTGRHIHFGDRNNAALRRALTQRWSNKLADFRCEHFRAAGHGQEDEKDEEGTEDEKATTFTGA